MTCFANIFKGEDLFCEKINEYTMINMRNDANVPNIIRIVLEFKQSLVSRFVRIHFSKDPENFRKFFYFCQIITIGLIYILITDISKKPKKKTKKNRTK